MSKQMALDCPQPTSAPARLAGMCAVVVAALVLRALPFHRVRSLASVMTRRTANPASATEAGAALAAVDAGGAQLPFRVACLERSLAATLMLAWRRRRVAWCVGVKLAPLASHAWIAVDGNPIGEADNVVKMYRVLFTTD